MSAPELIHDDRGRPFVITDNGIWPYAEWRDMNDAKIAHIEAKIARFDSWSRRVDRLSRCLSLIVYGLCVAQLVVWWLS